MSARVALATCAQLPRLGADEPLLLQALRDRGIDAEPAVWDDQGVDWDAFGLVVVRSTWDYAPRRDKFVAWARSLPRVLNPAEVIAWNTDKRYLGKLPRTVRTTFVAPGESWNPPEGEYVVKPTISSGSINAARYRRGEEDQARAHVARLLDTGRQVIVQPYLSAVDEAGETALLFFGGRYSHAIRKGPMLHAGRGPGTGLYVEEDIRPRDPSAAERETAEDVLDAMPWARDELLYARVDLIPGSDGAPRLVELELAEPSLFLSYSPGAPQRLAELVEGRL
jgi:glutathione synthase/RimK-type ligase-like ATP-grasp enzyme